MESTYTDGDLIKLEMVGHFKYKNDEIITYNIIEMQSLVPCGTCYLCIGQEITKHSGNIGYYVYPDYTGHNYAYKACESLLKIAKQKGMTTIQLLVGEGNIPSEKICNKLNAELKGTLVMEDNNIFDDNHQKKYIYEIKL